MRMTLLSCALNYLLMRFEFDIDSWVRDFVWYNAFRSSDIIRSPILSVIAMRVVLEKDHVDAGQENGYFAFCLSVR